MANSSGKVDHFPGVLKARHKPFWMAFYRWFSRAFFRFSFHTRSIQQKVELENKPILLLGNHFSFHEGFFLYDLNNSWFQRRFHLMMNESELKKRISLNKVGVFGVNKQSRSLITALQYTRELLRNPENLVVIFPAGRIQSLYSEHIPFASGVGRILKNSGDIQVIFQAAFVDYSSERKPGLSLYYETFSGPKTREAAEAAYNQFYHKSRENHRNRINQIHEGGPE